MAKTKTIKETEALFQEEKKEEVKTENPPLNCTPPLKNPGLEILNIKDLPLFHPELTLEKIEEALNRIIDEKFNSSVPIESPLPFNENEMQTWRGIYDSLQREFPVEAIKKADKNLTKKGYDTTGIGVQFCINRVNETVTPSQWDFTWEVLRDKEGATKSGFPSYDITVRTYVTICGVKKSFVGGHKGTSSYCDILKGAISNALKKTLSLYGVGRQAYEGTLDEDLREYEEKQVEEKQVSKAQNDAISKLCKTIPVSKEDFLKICNYDLEMKITPPTDGKSIVNSLTFDQKCKVIDHLNKKLAEMKKGEQEKITKLPERKEAVGEKK